MQIQAILTAIEFEPMKEILIFAVNTGARLSEALNVGSRNVKLPGKWKIEFSSSIDSYPLTIIGFEIERI